MCGTGKQAGPASDGSRDDGGAKPGRGRTGPSTGEQAEEVGGLGAPPTPELKGQDNQAAPVRAQQLRVSPLLAEPGFGQGGSLKAAGAPARLPASREGGHKGRVDCKLHTVPKGKAVGDDFEPTIVDLVDHKVQINSPLGLHPDDAHKYKARSLVALGRALGFGLPWWVCRFSRCQAPSVPLGTPAKLAVLQAFPAGFAS